MLFKMETTEQQLKIFPAVYETNIYFLKESTKELFFWNLLNKVYLPTSCVSKKHFNIILSSVHVFPTVSPFQGSWLTILIFRTAALSAAVLRQKIWDKNQFLKRGHSFRTVIVISRSFWTCFLVSRTKATNRLSVRLQTHDVCVLDWPKFTGHFIF